MKYRKKPIIVEAEQWIGQELDGVYFQECIIIGVPVTHAYLKTLEGDVRLKNGDWVITGIEGERYSCKHEDFIKTYESHVDEDLQS